MWGRLGRPGPLGHLGVDHLTSRSISGPRRVGYRQYMITLPQLLKLHSRSHTSDAESCAQLDDRSLAFPVKALIGRLVARSVVSIVRKRPDFVPSSSCRTVLLRCAIGGANTYRTGISHVALRPTFRRMQLRKSLRSVTKLGRIEQSSSMLAKMCTASTSTDQALGIRRSLDGKQ